MITPKFGELMKNLLDPAILFFVFGCFAGLIRSNLEIPRSIAKFLSLYLLMALGLKGGFALAKTGLNSEIALSMTIAIVMAFLVPTLGYLFLKNKIAKGGSGSWGVVPMPANSKLSNADLSTLSGWILRGAPYKN